MHGSTLLDAHDDVVRPALLWCDQRTTRQCAADHRDVGAARLIELTLNPALTGFTAPKLLWVREHEPEKWRDVRSVLLPKDYIRFRLTGYKATDVADASGTLLFDVGARKWSETMLDALDLKRVADARGVRVADGHRQRLARRGRGDGPAGRHAGRRRRRRPGGRRRRHGHRASRRRQRDHRHLRRRLCRHRRPVLEPGGRIHTFCHAVPGRWHVMGVTLGAGLSLRWFRDQFGAGPRRRPRSLRRDDRGRRNGAAGSDGVLWAPYLMGERTPHLDPHARAALVGLSGSHTRAHVVRAVLEGVAFSLKDSFSIFEAMRVPVSQVRLGGGGARSALWRRIQADMYGYPVEIVAAEEGAAYGAALLAGVGAGAGGPWTRRATRSCASSRGSSPTRSIKPRWRGSTSGSGRCIRR